MVTEDQIEDIRNVFEGDLAEDFYNRNAYAADPMPYDVPDEDIPGVVVKPESTDDVSNIMSYANKNEIPVHVHGAGTSFIGASRPKRGKGIVLDTGNMNDFEINEKDMYFEFGPGLGYNEASNMLEEKGYFLPSFPGSGLVATMGGLLSINTIGHLVDSVVGKPLDHTMGVEVVLPNGEVLETGTKAQRRVSGVDLTNFFVGTEGEFGIITRGRMELLYDQEEIYVVGLFENAVDVAKAYQRMFQTNTPDPLYGEFLSKEAAATGFERRGIDYPEGAVALARPVGRNYDEAMNKAEELSSCFKEVEGFIDTEIVEDEERQEKIWGARDYILGTAAAENGTWTAIDISPRVSKIPEAMDEIINYPESKLDVLNECKQVIYGHVGAGSIHSLWVIPRNWSEEKRKKATEEAIGVEREMNLKYEGAGGELGQMSGRIPFFKERWGEVGYSVLKDLKKAFDPNNILNPGNIEGDH